MWRTMTALIALVLLVFPPAIAQEKLADDAFRFKPGQSVYVIAVKSRAPQDRSFWQNLNRNLSKSPQGQMPPAPANNNRATLEREDTGRPTLDRAAPSRRVMLPEELSLKKQIEDEFLKQKNFKLADSPETADIIFFAQGEYFHFEAMRQGTGFASIGMLTAGDDKLDLNALAKLSVAAVAASDYRQWQSDVPRLFEKAKWHEELWGEFRRDRDKPYEEPSAKKIVQQFHKQALKK